MALSKREKYIGMGVGAALGLLLLDQTILSPYLAKLADLKQQTDAAVEKQAENQALFDKQDRLRKVWADITRNKNLKEDESAAESQALNEAVDWAQSAGVAIQSVKLDRSMATDDFQVIGFQITATGSTPEIARLVQSFETAAIPVRVDDMTITPNKEGTDDLKIVLTLSTLSAKPPSETAKPAVSAAFGTSEARPWNE